MNKLLGRRIVLTRPTAQATRLAEGIAAQGGEVVRLPLLEISPAADTTPLQQAITRLDDYALVIFISPNAVDFSLPVITAQSAWPLSVRAAAIGQSTATQLAAYGVTHVITPSTRFESEALLDLPELQTTNVGGKKVLILRGNGGRELLAETLIKRGATVDRVTCYQRSAPADAARILAQLHNTPLDALIISSSESLRNLWALLDPEAVERWRALPLFVPHQRIAHFAAELGIKRIVLTAPADTGLLEGLCNFCWPNDGLRY